MRTLVLLSLLVAAGCPSSGPKAADPAPKKGSAPAEVADSKFQPNEVVVDHEVALLDGTTKKLSDYRGKALLVVNTASECGFTPQYADLQQVYAKYKEQGLEVLAFPSNDFGSQEPGTPEDIRTFVDGKYQVEFEMFDKVHAKGGEISPLYQTLSEKTGTGIRGEVKWNFTKFLIDPQGKVVARFEPDTKPTDAEIIAAIEGVLPAT